MLRNKHDLRNPINFENLLGYSNLNNFIGILFATFQYKKGSKNTRHN